MGADGLDNVPGLNLVVLANIEEEAGHARLELLVEAGAGTLTRFAGCPFRMIRLFVRLRLQQAGTFILVLFAAAEIGVIVLIIQLVGFFAGQGGIERLFGRRRLGSKDRQRNSSRLYGSGCCGCLGSSRFGGLSHSRDNGHRFSGSWLDSSRLDGGRLGSSRFSGRRHSLGSSLAAGCRLGRDGCSLNIGCSGGFSDSDRRFSGGDRRFNDGGWCFCGSGRFCDRDDSRFHDGSGGRFRSRRGGRLGQDGRNFGGDSRCLGTDGGRLGRGSGTAARLHRGLSGGTAAGDHFFIGKNRLDLDPGGGLEGSAHRQAQHGGGHIGGCVVDILGRGHIQSIGELFDVVQIRVEVALLELLTHIVQDRGDAAFGHVHQGRRLGPHDVALGKMLDVLEIEDLTSDDKGVRLARLPGAAGAADSVDIVFSVLGQVEVDDNLDVLDIDAAGSHIGGNQQVDIAAAEAVHHPGAHHLLHVAVECLGGIAAGLQLFGQLVDLLLGVAEHKRQLDALGFDQAAENLDLVRLADLDVELLDVGDRHLLRGDPNMQRFAQVLVGQLDDRARQRRREEDLLDLLRARVEDRVDVFLKAHVEHFIGFVEDDPVQFVEADRLAAHVVHDAARRADDDLGLLLEREDLAVDRLAAVDREDAHAFLVLADVVQLVGDLDGELARRREDQVLDVMVVRIDPLDDRDAESSRLAGAGLSLAQHVAAFHDVGNGLGLDGGGFFEAHFADGAQDFL